MPRTGMLRIHASLAAAVDGSSAEAISTARAANARFIGTSFLHQERETGRGPRTGRAGCTNDVNNRSRNSCLPCSRSQLGKRRARATVVFRVSDLESQLLPSCNTQYGYGSRESTPTLAMEIGIDVPGSVAGKVKSGNCIPLRWDVICEDTFDSIAFSMSVARLPIHEPNTCEKSIAEKSTPA